MLAQLPLQIPLGRLSAQTVRVTVASRDEDVLEGVKRICDFIFERKERAAK